MCRVFCVLSSSSGLDAHFSRRLAAFDETHSRMEQNCRIHELSIESGSRDSKAGILRTVYLNRLKRVA